MTYQTYATVGSNYIIYVDMATGRSFSTGSGYDAIVKEEDNRMKRKLMADDLLNDNSMVLP